MKKELKHYIPKILRGDFNMNFESEDPFEKGYFAMLKALNKYLNANKDSENTEIKYSMIKKL